MLPAPHGSGFLLRSSTNVHQHQRKGACALYTARTTSPHSLETTHLTSQARHSSQSMPTELKHSTHAGLQVASQHRHARRKGSNHSLVMATHHSRPKLGARKALSITTLAVRPIDTQQKRHTDRTGQEWGWHQLYTPRAPRSLDRGVVPVRGREGPK